MQGVLFSKEPLAPGTCFQVKVDQIDGRWTGSLMIGVTGQRPEKVSSPMNALAMKRQTWVVCGNAVHHCGLKIRGDLTFNLNQLQSGQSVGVYLSESGHLHVLIDGQDQGAVASVGTTVSLYAVIDLYGKCTEVSIVSTPRTGPQSATCLEEKGHRETSATEKDCPAVMVNLAQKIKIKIKVLSKIFPKYFQNIFMFHIVMLVLFHIQFWNILCKIID